MSDNERGLYRKYNVERTDGTSAPGGKHADCRYFVLDLEHDEFSVPALQAYATAAESKFPNLARDLFEMVGRNSLQQALAASQQETERLRKESDDLSRYHLEEFARYKQARNEQHERYDVLHAQFTAAQATLAAECVEHVELNGHIDLAEQCRDWLAMRDDDAGGRIQEFVDSLGVVISQLDRQRRRANWYEAAHEAGKEKLIESRLAKALAPAREAAHALANAVTALGLAAPDTPEVLATAEPIADAEFKLWSALGIDKEHPAVTESRRNKEGGVEP